MTSTIFKLRFDLEPCLNKEYMDWHISGLAIQYANLKSAIQDGCLDSYEITARSTRLDDAVRSLAKYMLSNRLYEQLILKKPRNGHSSSVTTSIQIIINSGLERDRLYELYRRYSKGYVCHCTSICSTQNSRNEGRDLLRNPDYYATLCLFHFTSQER